jgi:predicted hotdog family 3-hydroxylacyl-ACP dehydratase
MAVHGALVASAAGVAAPPGFLASARAVQLHCDRLDDLHDDLVAAVERIAGDTSTALYDFSVSAGEIVLLRGRVAIAFDVIGSQQRADRVGAQRAGDGRRTPGNQEPL